MTEEVRRRKEENTPPSEPGQPKALRPWTPKPPTGKTNIPLPCVTRDMTPNPENGIYEGTSMRRQGPENQSGHALKHEKETPKPDGDGERASEEESG